MAVSYILDNQINATNEQQIPYAPPLANHKIYENSAASQEKNLEVDILCVAKQALASLAICITNSILSVIVGVMKITGFLVLTSLVLGMITKPLHSANLALAKHSFAPFRKWAEAISNENTRIVTTDCVVSIKNRTVMFYPENYIKQAHESLKIAVAPLSATLSSVNFVAWYALKPLYIFFIAPGIIADGLMTIPLGLNKLISKLTYTPLSNLASKMSDNHSKRLENIWNFAAIDSGPNLIS